MGDTDGSSSAARSAQLKNDNSKQKPLNILARIARLFSLGSQLDQLDTNENIADLKTHDKNEVGNLLRLSVEDVSIPKADIVAVYDKITKNELSEIEKNDVQESFSDSSQISKSLEKHISSIFNL